MRIVHRDKLIACMTKHPESRPALESWFHEVSEAIWKSSIEIKKSYASASFLHGNRVVFNILSNHFRVVTVINYEVGVVEIRFSDTHAEYNKIKAEQI